MTTPNPNSTDGASSEVEKLAKEAYYKLYPSFHSGNTPWNWLEESQRQHYIEFVKLHQQLRQAEADKEVMRDCIGKIPWAGIHDFGWKKHEERVAKALSTNPGASLLAELELVKEQNKKLVDLIDRIKVKACIASSSPASAALYEIQAMFDITRTALNKSKETT